MVRNNGNNRQIVIAEDSPTQAEKLRYTLENLGFEVFHGQDGRFALEWIRKLHPSMIISDVVMPEMDGFELCRQVRSDPSIQSIPFIMLTTMADSGEILRGLEAGADSYIMKPFNEQYLDSQLKQVMENRSYLRADQTEEPISLNYGGVEYRIGANAGQILSLLFSSYESARHQNAELRERKAELDGVNEILQNKVESRREELQKELDQITAAENKLKATEEDFRELVDHALVGIFIAEMDGSLVLCNEALAAVLDFPSQKALLQLNLRDIVELPGDLDQMLEMLKEKQGFTAFETRVKTSHANVIDVLISASFHAGSFSAMVLDISEQKESERRMRVYETQLLQAKEDAERSENLKTAFLANMSNEILNPLNSLLGFTELLGRDHPPLPQIQEYIDQVNRSGNLLINLIDNIVDLARVESGEMQINKTDFNVNQMLLDLYARHSKVLQQAEGKKVELVLKREQKEADFGFMTEAHRLNRILDNLLNNAVKYTNEGIIEFGYTLQESGQKDEADRIQFYVKDTGKGIPADKLPWLFDRFRITDNKYTKLSEGTGLGLPLTKAYVELLGGEIWCKSEQGKGSEFYFTIPFLRTGEITPDAEPLKVAISGTLYPGKKILVAEDIPSNFKLIEALLTEINPVLTWARDGREAVDLLREDPDIELILMDLRMPVMDGSEAIKKIRSFDPDIPIIVQTAFAREEERGEILGLGCNSFITKPIKKQELLLEIHRLVGRAGPGPA